MKLLLIRYGQPKAEAISHLWFAEARFVPKMEETTVNQRLDSRSFVPVFGVQFTVRHVSSLSRTTSESKDAREEAIHGPEAHGS